MDQLPDDTLTAVLRYLQPDELLSASRASRSIAAASEPIFEQLCNSHRWRPARRPRGHAADVKAFPWRAMYRLHACVACGKLGEFPVRRAGSALQEFLTCKRCVGTLAVQQRLVREDMTVDLVSLTGKRLIRNRSRIPFKGSVLRRMWEGGR